MKWKFPMVAPAPVASSLQRPPLPFRSSGDPEAVPLIESVSFQGSTIRSGGVAVARVRGRDLDPDAVRCDGANAGFVVDLLPERTEQGNELVFGIRIFRRMGTPRGLCLIRFRCGPATAVASITVRF
jgi:hypothetical protein